MRDHNIFMIVDDDKDDRFFFLIAINEVEPSCECLTAGDGEEALEILSTADPLPDYIFLDINMPRINGWQCLTALKKNGRLKHIPVIIYSTSDYQADIERSLALGAAYYLVKQTNVRDLPAALIKALESVKEPMGANRAK